MVRMASGMRDVHGVPDGDEGIFARAHPDGRAAASRGPLGAAKGRHELDRLRWTQRRGYRTECREDARCRRSIAQHSSTAHPWAGKHDSMSVSVILLYELADQLCDPVKI